MTYIGRDETWGSIRRKINDFLTADRPEIRIPITSFPGAREELAKSFEDQDWQPILTSALSLNIPISLPSHSYPLRSACTPINPTATPGLIYYEGPTVDIEFEGNAELVIGEEVADATPAVLSFVSTPYPATMSGCFSVKNCKIDFTHAAAATTGLSGIDVYGYRGGVIENFKAYSKSYTDPDGDLIGYGGGDTGITTHNCRDFHIVNAVGEGLREYVIYVSGDNGPAGVDGVGEGVMILGGSAYRCGAFVAGKRGAFGTTVIGAHLSECLNGIFGSPADGVPASEGKGWTIIGNRMNKIQGRPIALYGGPGDVVTGNHIWDYGLRVSDQTYTPVSSGRQIAAVGLYGVTGAVVANNTCGYAQWVPPVTDDINRSPRSIIFGVHQGVGCTRSSANDNISIDVFGGFLENTPGDYNTFAGNQSFGFTDGDRVQGPNSLKVLPLPKSLYASALAVTNYDTITESGWYRGGSTAIGAPTNSGGLVFHIQSEPGYAVQKFYRSTARIAYQRQMIAGVWPATWEDVLDTEFALDTRYVRLPKTTQISSDANVTVSPRVEGPYIRHTGAITAVRTLTIQNTDARVGDYYHVVRLSGGAFNLEVRRSDGLLKALATGGWCKVVYDGNNWYLAAAGTIN